MDINGLMLFGKQVPVEILCNILAFVDADTLVFSCRLVCKEWKSVTDDLVWDAKIDCTKKLIGHPTERRIPWWVAYWISKKKLFERNLLKNTCGEKKIKGWNVTDHYSDGWVSEKLPTGAPPLPASPDFGRYTSCFASSYSWCSKSQVVKLVDFGLTDKIMDEIKPDFEISEWICTRFDCGGEYVLSVSLLDENKGRSIKEIETVKLVMESGMEEWKKITAKLAGPYDVGARFLKFSHSGKDNQFWKGHYGIKISGTIVKPVFPSERFVFFVQD